MEKKLLLLGFLISHSAHGYELSRALDRSSGAPITLTRPNAYRLLANMETDGWVTHREEKHGNRPNRRVYTVTKKGRDAYLRLLRENLAGYRNPEFPAAVGLNFVSSLPRDECLALLDKRAELMRATIDEWKALPSEIRESHLTVDCMLQHYRAEHTWLRGVIRRMEAS